MSVPNYRDVNCRNLIREGLAIQSIDAAVNGHAHPDAAFITILRDAGWRIEKTDNGNTITITIKRPGR